MITRLRSIVICFLLVLRGIGDTGVAVAHQPAGRLNVLEHRESPTIKFIADTDIEECPDTEIRLLLGASFVRSISIRPNNTLQLEQAGAILRAIESSSDIRVTIVQATDKSSIPDNVVDIRYFDLKDRIGVCAILKIADGLKINNLNPLFVAKYPEAAGTIEIWFPGR